MNWLIIFFSFWNHYIQWKVSGSNKTPITEVTKLRFVSTSCPLLFTCWLGLLWIWRKKYIQKFWYGTGINFINYCCITDSSLKDFYLSYVINFWLLLYFLFIIQCHVPCHAMPCAMCSAQCTALCTTMCTALIGKNKKRWHELGGCHILELSMLYKWQVFAWLPNNLHYKSLSNDEFWKKGWI